LRNSPYKNHDGILTILTPDGYLTVLARGSLKMTSPFAATTSLGTWATFTLSKTKNRFYLEKATLIQFAPMAPDQGILASMMMQTALQIALIHDDPEEGKIIYQALVEFRSNLKEPGYQWLIFLTAYLQMQGVPMIVSYCVKCQQTKNIVGLSIHLGGFVCQTCLPTTDALTLSAQQLTALLQLHRQPTNLSGKNSLIASLIPLFHQHFQYHLDLRLQGFETIENLLSKIHS
jgi:DNA repair protein RecO (recombination protein O)